MSTSRSRRERELKRLQWRLSTQPDRPILRTADSPPIDDSGPAAPTAPVAARGSQTSALHSVFPTWACLLTLPPDLDTSFRGFLFRYIESHIRPSDPHEHWLAARIALAMARLHVHASREPAEPSPPWLRYEQLADRQLRQARRDLELHRAASRDTAATAASLVDSPVLAEPLAERLPSHETSSTPTVATPQPAFRPAVSREESPPRRPPATVDPARSRARRPQSPSQSSPDPHDPTFAISASVDDLAHKLHEYWQTRTPGSIPPSTSA